MNINEMISEIKKAKWFSEVGSYPGGGGKRPIRSLAAWDSNVFAEGIDAHHAEIAAQMDWLPTTRDQSDPFHGESLRNELQEAGPEAKAKVMEAYKQAMKSLGTVEASKLASGQNNFSEAATGAALYCSRMAAMEVVTGKPAIWCDLFEVYCAGYWPCGILPSGDVVVY